MNVEEALKKELERISRMSRVEMCRIWRFAGLGHPYFRKDSPLWPVFEKRFNELGGMSPEISKLIGWNK